MDSVKNYIVNYQVTAENKAGEQFNRIAKAAKAAEENIAPLMNQMRQINAYLKGLASDKNLEAIKQLYNIKPTMDFSVIDKQIKELQQKSVQAANQIARAYQKAFEGQETVGKSKAKTFNDMLKKNIDELKKERAETAKIIANQFNGRYTDEKGFERLTTGTFSKEKGVSTTSETYVPINLNDKRYLSKLQKTVVDKAAFNEALEKYNTLQEAINQKMSKAPKAAAPIASTAVQETVKQNEKDTKVATNSLVSQYQEFLKKYDNFTAQFQAKQEAQKAAITKYNKVAKSNFLPSFKELDEHSAEAIKDKFPSAYSAYKTAKQNAPEMVQMFKQKKELEAQKEELAKKLQEAASTPVATAPTTKKVEKVISSPKTDEKEYLGTSAVNLGKAAENLQKLNEAVKSFGTGDKKINLTADITAATEQINKFLETVRSMRVAIPITFGGNGFNAKKAIDEATGSITEEGKQANKVAEGLFKEKRGKDNKKGLVASMPDIVKQLDETVKALNSKTQHIDIAIRIVAEGAQAQLEAAVKELKVPSIEVPIQLGKLSASGKSKKNKAGLGQLEQAAQEIQKQADSLKQQINEKNKNVSVKFKTSLDDKGAKDQLKSVAQELKELAAKEKILFSASIKPIEGKVEDIVSKLKGNRKIEIPFQAKLKSSGMVGQMRSVVDDVKDKKVAVNIGVKLVSTGASAQLDDIIKGVQEKASKKSSIRIKVGLSKTGYWSDLNNIVKDIREQSSKRRVEIPIKLVTEKVSEQFSKLLSQLQKEAESHPIKINTTVNIAESMAKLRESVDNLSKVVSKSNGKSSIRANSAAVGGSNRFGGGIIDGARNTVSERAYLRSPGKAMGGGANTDFYTRMRAWAYPITGNTSFGAQTPYALSMMKDMGSMMAVGGVMGAIGTGLHQAIDYQNTMKTVQAILQTSDDNYNNNTFNQMQRIVRNVGKKTKFTAPQVAGAARFMAMAGLNTRDISNAIRPVADVALIGDTDLATTADKLTNVMTTFGLKSNQMRDIADIMTSTFTRSNTDMMMLAESAKYAGGIAHLYGGKDFMKTFSDTMAMFGVLGNSGIQASSAGTTIRMMYQNLMQPNKNQLKELQKYHIFTRDKNGQPLQMVDILKELAAKVPREQMADAIGKMFRITAQPGAAALATHIYDLVGNPATGKKGLIEANREAMGTDVSGHIADQKKMTLSGLIYQVQSAFGEGILQAVEHRQAKWTELLGKLRDFLAKPETIESLSKIVDLVENMATVMLKFVNIWAKAYAFAPSLVNTFLTIQMFMTQLGYLITPLTQMVGVMHTFGLRMGAFKRLMAGGTMASMSAAGGASLGGVAEGAFMAVGNTRFRSGQATLLPYIPLAEQKKQKEMAEYSRRMASLKHFANLSGRRAQRYKWAARDLGNVAFTGMTLAESRQFIHQRMRLGATMPGDQRVIRAAQAQEEAMASAAMAERMHRDAQARMAEMRAVQHERLMAIRRPMQLEDAALMRRFARMHPVENMKRSFSAGRALMAVDLMSTLRSMGTSIKGFFTNLMGGLAKAVGMLTSPVGLAIGALAALGAVIYSVYKDYKKRQSEINNINKGGEIAQKSFEHTRKNAINTAINSLQHLKAAKNIVTKQNKPQPKFLGGTNAQLAHNKALSALDGNNGVMSADRVFHAYGLNKNIYLDPDVIKDYNNKKARYIGGKKELMYTGGYAIPVESSELINSAKQVAVISEWAKLAVQAPKTQKALNDMAKAIADGNKTKQQEILAQYKPSSLLRMSELNGPNAVKRIQNPAIYYEYQYAQYKALRDMMDNGIGVAGHYAHATSMINSYNKLNTKERERFNGAELARQLAQSVTLSINGSKVALSLDKMGNIDWATLANTVNNGVPLNFAQQKDILQNVYSAIYNDPSIANSANIVALLDKYLPQIANLTLNIPNFNPTGDYWVNEPRVLPGKKSAKNGRRPAKNDLLSGLPRINLNGGLKFKMPEDPLNANIKKKGYLFGTAKAQGVGHKKSQSNVLHHSTASAHVPAYTRKGNGGGITSGTYGGTTPKNKHTPSQKDYANTYGGGSSKPTIVNINIQNLCNFDRTMITKNIDDKRVAEICENKVSEGIAMLTSIALTEAGGRISDGLNHT